MTGAKIITLLSLVIQIYLGQCQWFYPRPYSRYNSNKWYNALNQYLYNNYSPYDYTNPYTGYGLTPGPCLNPVIDQPDIIALPDSCNQPNIIVINDDDDDSDADAFQLEDLLTLLLTTNLANRDNVPDVPQINGCCCCCNCGCQNNDYGNDNNRCCCCGNDNYNNNNRNNDCGGNNRNGGCTTTQITIVLPSCFDVTEKSEIILNAKNQ